MNPSALECLLSRFSTGPKHLVDPGPNASQLELMVQAGLRGPDHGELVPWRVVVIDGAAKVRMADLFVQHAQQKGKSPEAIEMERDRALRAPTTLAVIAQIDPAHPLVPAHEQWMCIGGATTNKLNAGPALGLWRQDSQWRQNPFSLHLASLLPARRNFGRLDHAGYAQQKAKHQ